MSFDFGGVKASAKKLSNIAREKINFLIEDHFDESERDFYIFLLESITSNDKMAELKKLINKYGYKSYFILSSVNTLYHKEKEKSLTDFFVQNQSNWTKYINYNNRHVKAIMAFGGSLYGINKSADLLTEYFYTDGMTKPYYYLGHGFIGDYDTFIYPVDSMEEIFPISITKGSYVNFKTRILYDMLYRMRNEEREYPDLTPYEIIQIKEKNDADKVLKDNFNKEYCSFDLETSSFDWTKDEIGCLTLSFDGNIGYFIPWKFVDANLFHDMLSSCKNIIGANPKFDIHHIWEHGVKNDVFPTDDITLMAHAIYSSRAKGLKPLSFMYTYFGGYDNELDNFKTQTKIEVYTKIPNNILSKYATLDAIVAYRCYMALLKQMRWIDTAFPNEKKYGEKIENFYRDIMMPSCNDFISIEHRGTYVNVQQQLIARKWFENEIEKSREELSKIWKVDKDFDFFSSKKVGEQIERMGWPVIERNKAGGYSTSENCMNEWARQNQPGIELFAKLRQLNTNLNMFIGHTPLSEDDKTGWDSFIRYHKEDNSFRMHQSYLLFGTETYRFIGKDPNLQQVPTHNFCAPKVKRVIGVPCLEHYKITSDDGTVYEGYEETELKVKRDNKEIIVKMPEIKEEDDILCYA